jgi:hypothetical protein
MAKELSGPWSKNEQIYEVDTVKEKRTRENIQQAAERNARWIS